MEANPYDPSIEKQTWFYPNMLIGINMDTVDEKDCGFLFHDQSLFERFVEDLKVSNDSGLAITYCNFLGRHGEFHEEMVMQKERVLNEFILTKEQVDWFQS